MKTSLIIGMILMLSFFIQQLSNPLSTIVPHFQTENFFEMEEHFSLPLAQNRISAHPPAVNSKQMMGFFFPTIIKSLVPLATIVLMMFFFMTLGIFHSSKKQV